MKKVLYIFFKSYYFSFEKVIIKLDIVALAVVKYITCHKFHVFFLFFFRLASGVWPHKGRMKFPSSVQCFFFCFFFQIGLWCMASQRKNEISYQCPKQPGQLLCHVTHHHCYVMKCDFVTMNAKFLPSTILNGIKYVE